MHITDGTIRRLLDEPLAIADRDRRHVDSCARCRARRARIASDAELAAAMLSLPERLRFPATPPVWDLDGDAITSRVPSRVRVRPRRLALLGASVGTGASVGIGAAVLVGVAAAATLTTVFAPTRVAPLPVSSTDAQALSALLGVGGGTLPGGFPAPSGQVSLPFGTLEWHASDLGQQVSSLAAAESATGLSVRSPSSLPQGVGAIDKVVVLGKVEATVTFDSAAGASLAGSTLTIDAGPGIAATYAGASGGPGLPVLGIVAVGRPVATSTGATAADLEQFLLSRPGLPSDLAAELRLLGSETLPIPTPPGATSQSTSVDGEPAVVISDGTNSITGVVFEDAKGVVHAAAGLLAKSDLLHVAQQVG